MAEASKLAWRTSGLLVAIYPTTRCCVRLGSFHFENCCAFRFAGPLFSRCIFYEVRRVMCVQQSWCSRLRSTLLYCLIDCCSSSSMPRKKWSSFSRRQPQLSTMMRLASQQPTTHGPRFASSNRTAVVRPAVQHEYFDDKPVQLLLLYVCIKWVCCLCEILSGSLLYCRHPVKRCCT